MSETFRALVLQPTGSGDGYEPRLTTLTVDDLPPGEVLVDVAYSDLNFKDGLAITNRGKIVRKLPLVPGIDLAGTVAASESAHFAPGDEVLVTGWGIGEVHWGGYAQKARVAADWLVPLPEGLTLRHAMAVGTAGFTAMQCVMALEDGDVEPEAGPVLVTGAAGGVGSLAVAILAQRGYEVVAVTGRPEHEAWLRSLGAAGILPRSEMAAACRPLEPGRWAGAVDTVGSTTLARVLAEVREWGTVAACGLAGGAEFETTVMPFLLRGLRLQGIHSVTVPMAKRPGIWRRIVSDLPLDKLEATIVEIGLDELVDAAAAITEGRVRGRTLVDVNC